MNLIQIRERIEKSWTKECSYHPEEWTYDNPAYGCCAVTSKLIYDLVVYWNNNSYESSAYDMDNEIMKGYFFFKDKLRPHYWNRINGVDFDLAFRQFSLGTSLTNIQEISVDELITDDWMQNRYDNFLANYNKQL